MDEFRQWLAILSGLFVGIASLTLSVLSFRYLVRRNRETDAGTQLDAKVQPVQKRVSALEDEWKARQQEIHTLRETQQRVLSELESHESQNNYRFQDQSTRMGKLEDRLEKLQEQIHSDISELAAAIRESMSSNQTTLKLILERVAPRDGVK